MYYIYQITNNITGDIYIGKTHKTAIIRWREHITTVQRRLSKSQKLSHIHAAINKYGPDNFTVDVLEEVDENKALLCEREIYWITILTPRYNATRGGETGPGSIKGSVKSTEHRKALSLAHLGKYWIHNPITLEEKCLMKNHSIDVGWVKGRSPKTSHGGKIGEYGESRCAKYRETRMKNGTYRVGTPHSQKTKKHLSEALTGRSVSSETRTKMSESAKLRVKKSQRDKTGKFTS